MGINLQTLMPLALKLPNFKCLTYLDLSYNKMDNCSESIMVYLRSFSCTLTTLLLNGAGKSQLAFNRTVKPFIIVISILYCHDFLKPTSFYLYEIFALDLISSLSSLLLLQLLYSYLSWIIF